MEQIVRKWFSAQFKCKGEIQKYKLRNVMQFSIASGFRDMPHPTCAHLINQVRDKRNAIRAIVHAVLIRIELTHF